MIEKKRIFPDGQDDVFLGIQHIKGQTNFSYMGEADGIEIFCTAVFQTKANHILMHPDWEEVNPTEALQTKFPHGYYIFEDVKKEVIYYHFLLDYEKSQDQFHLRLTKRKDETGHYYINAITKYYTAEAINAFEHQLYQTIMKTYIKKRTYD